MILPAFVILVILGVFVYRSQRKIISEQRETLRVEGGKLEAALRSAKILNKTGKEINSTLDLKQFMDLVYRNISEQMDVSFFLSSAPIILRSKRFLLNSV